jgi:hypothetical protein
MKEMLLEDTDGEMKQWHVVHQKTTGGKIMSKTSHMKLRTE